MRISFRIKSFFVDTEKWLDKVLREGGLGRKGNVECGIKNPMMEIRDYKSRIADYYLAVIQQRFYGDYPFVTSILIPNNVQGGLGNFSAFTARKSGWVDLR